MDLRRLLPRAVLPADLAAINDERLRRLADYWLAKRGDSVVARRADIDPTEMKWILPHIWLHDVDPETGRQRCRLAGEEVRAMYATNIIGKYVDEYLLSTNWAEIEAHFNAIVDGPCIGYAKGQVYRAAIEQFGHGERIALPLTDDEGQRVTMLIGATIYRALPGTTNPAARREGIERVLVPLASGVQPQA